MRRSAFVFLIVSATALGAGTNRARAGRASHAVSEQPSPPLDQGAINNTVQAPLMPDAKGPGVVRAQILLGRAHFSCGSIDGHFGSNLEKTVAAFQAERHLPITNSVDDATWAQLNQDQAPLLTNYTITSDDEAGPFVRVPKDLTKQSSLQFLGYASPLDELAERFHASPAVLSALNPGADFAGAGEQLMVPNVLVLPPGEASRIEIAKSESSVRAYKADGTLLAFYVATIGSEHDPLPIGTWRITGVQRNPDFHYNAALFWDARNPNATAVIKPGPRNPVGLVWIDLSKPHYGIHGTPDPGLIGHSYSHGCIRLTNWDGLELASMVKPGVPVILKN